MSGTGSDSGWLEAAIAWEVCASLHRQYCKGKDALFTTRQSDFVKHAENARGRAPPAQEARVLLSDEGVGKRAKVGPIHTEPGGKVSMFSAQYRQQLEQCYVRGFRDAEKHHGITAAQKETP